MHLKPYLSKRSLWILALVGSGLPLACDGGPDGDTTDQGQQAAATGTSTGTSTGTGTTTGTGGNTTSSGTSSTGAGGVGGSPSVALQFESSFDTALGTNDAALLDGNRWEDYAGLAQTMLEVVGPENGVSPIDGSGMLRIAINGEDNAGIVVSDAFDLTQDEQYIRFYVNIQCIGEDVGLSHYVEDFDSHLGLADSNNFFWRHTAYRASTGRYRMGWSTYASQDGAGNGCNGSGNQLGPNIQTWGRIGADSPINIETDDDPNGLSCGEWYRVEIGIQCQESGCFNQDRTTAVPTYYHMRVYDEVGIQVIGDQQLRTMSVGGVWQSGSPGVTVAEAYDSNQLDTCYFMASGRPSFHIGNNGQAGETASARAWMYFDRVAISHEGWIGP